MKVKELLEELASYLCISDFEDADVSMNGLQVGNPDTEVVKVAFAVDACQKSIDAAVKEKANVLFVHHGLFWGKPIAVTGAHYKRIKTLIDNNICLIACHLPLDAHMELGNNFKMAEKIGLENIKPFCEYHGKMIGCSGVLKKGLSNEEIIKALGIRKNGTTVVIPGGKKKSKKIGIVSGGAPYDVEDAIKENLDAYITGENAHSVYHTCIENKINMLCLGHYETETFGVKAVADFVEKKYGIETVFLDVPSGL